MKAQIFPLLVVLAFASCDRPELTQTAPATPAETPTEAPANALAQPGVLYPAVILDERFMGVWRLSDPLGGVYDLVIFRNGQAVTTSVVGSPLGGRGLWRVLDGSLVVMYLDGTIDMLSRLGDQVEHRAFRAANLQVPVGPRIAEKLTGAAADFVGVWRLNPEPDGSFLYVLLLSGGRALSSAADSGEGSWELRDGGVLCKWPDGWHDLITPSEGGFQKRSWVGSAQDDTTPPDVSQAVRVGEGRFSIVP